MQMNKVDKLQLQLCSVPESEGLVLEFLDENEDAFMDIRIQEDGRRQVVIYPTTTLISFSLSEMLKGIAIAEDRVINIPPISEEDDDSDHQ